jgi:hypothetical protein
MRKRDGCFQFFFSSKEQGLPYPEVTTRDVTDTWRAGNKTEPHFEKMMENWCPCRARFVTANVKKALAAQTEDRTCMILTTNDPQTNDNLAVGVLYFSAAGYQRFMARFPRRWNEKKYLPYVGSKKSKLVSLNDAFHLRGWMNKNGKRYLPGKRYGIVNAPPDLLKQILDHFAGAPDQTPKFLANVRYLEIVLKSRSNKRWTNYSNRKRGFSYNCSSCSSKAIRKASC